MCDLFGDLQEATEKRGLVNTTAACCFQDVLIQTLPTSELQKSYFARRGYKYKAIYWWCLGYRQGVFKGERSHNFGHCYRCVGIPQKCRVEVKSFFGSCGMRIAFKSALQDCNTHDLNKRKIIYEFTSYYHFNVVNLSTLNPWNMFSQWVPSMGFLWFGSRRYSCFMSPLYLPTVTESFCGVMESGRKRIFHTKLVIVVVANSQKKWSQKNSNCFSSGG